MTRKARHMSIGYRYWDDAAGAAVQYITSRDHPARLGTIAALRRIEDKLIAEYFDKEPEVLDPRTIQNIWASIGAEAFLLAAKQNENFSVEYVRKVLVRKQTDYGPENIRRFGRRGLIVRMHDKVARLENLLSSGSKPNNESIADNILDVIGYAAIGIMWEGDQFLLPLKSKSVSALTTS